MNVLNEVEDLMYINMWSILNKIAAFDVEEYEELQSKGFPPNEVSEEKMNGKKKNKNNKIGFSSGEVESEETDLLTVTTEELVKFGMLAELIGRFSDTYVYKELTKDNLKRILLESKNSPLLLKLNRYMNDLTQSETSNLLGISQVQVSRNEAKILQKLRDRL